MVVKIVQDCSPAENGSLSFNYGDELIQIYRIDRSLVSNKLLIKVYPNGQVVVSTPPATPNDKLLAAVKQRGRWIYQQLREIRQQLSHVTPRQYISGESHYYLGKQYLLKVIHAPKQEQHVKLLRGKLEVSARSTESQKIHTLLSEWYRARAKEVFAARLDAMLEQTVWLSHKPSLHILTMQTQWGSCSPNGRITLNPLLVKAPRLCIDYVILHELCHLAEHNHSERFYRLMTQVMPQWEHIKKRLDGMAHQLFN